MNNNKKLVLQTVNKTQKRTMVAISSENHEKIKLLSKNTGIKIEALTNIMLDYALNNIQVEDGTKPE